MLYVVYMQGSLQNSSETVQNCVGKIQMLSLLKESVLPEFVRIVQVSVLEPASSVWLMLSPMAAMCASEMSEAGQ